MYMFGPKLLVTGFFSLLQYFRHMKSTVPTLLRQPSIIQMDLNEAWLYLKFCNFYTRVPMNFSTDIKIWVFEYSCTRVSRNTRIKTREY